MKGSYNDGQQMRTLQKRDHHLSFHNDKLNTEEEESPPLSEEDEQSDDNMLKI